MWCCIYILYLLSIIFDNKIWEQYCPDLLDVFAVTNELLASLVISSKNHESLCEEQKLKAKHTGCCRGFIRYEDTQQIQGRGTSNTSQAIRQPQIELPGGEWAGWARPALGWQWPNSSHPSTRVDTMQGHWQSWDEHGCFTPQLHSAPQKRSGYRGRNSAAVSPALPKNHLPSWMCPAFSTPQIL